MKKKQYETSPSLTIPVLTKAQSFHTQERPQTNKANWSTTTIHILKILVKKETKNVSETCINIKKTLHFKKYIDYYFKDVYDFEMIFCALLKTIDVIV